MNLLPQTPRALQRRRCGGFFDLFSGKSSTSVSTSTSVNQTSTATTTDSYNNTYNRVANTSVNVGDLSKTLAAAGGDTGGLDVKKILLGLGAALGLLFLFKLFTR